MVLRPFASVTKCPACGGATTACSVRFSDHEQLPAGCGRFVDVQVIGAPLVPHLEKHCPHCDFGWLEQMAP